MERAGDLVPSKQAPFIAIALHEEEPNSLGDLLPVTEIDDINFGQRLTLLACQALSPREAPEPEHPVCFLIGGLLPKAPLQWCSLGARVPSKHRTL